MAGARGNMWWWRLGCLRGLDSHEIDNVGVAELGMYSDLARNAVEAYGTV